MKTKLHHLIHPFLFATALAAGPLSAQAASAAELLEKGIYTEETKGDLDAAITLYQQVVADGKTAHGLAAQAQYRLALCYQKKQRTAEATAAFEALIRDFPGEKELVAQAREHLPAEIALQPISWADGERLHYVLTMAAGQEIGAMETRADLLEADGKKIWRVGRRMSGGGEMVSAVEVDAATFLPIASTWKHTLLGEVTAVFRPGEVEMQKAGSSESTKLPLDKTVFDNEECFHLLRRLPFAVGYKATVNVITTLAGGGVIPLGVEVVKKETLETPAGKFDCFKLQLSIGQTLWYADDASRCLVQFEAGGAIGKLTAIAHRKSGQPVTFRDAELGISFQAPADWLVHRYGSGPVKKEVLIRTYDPAGDATDGGLRIFATDQLPAATGQSSRQWAESHLAKVKAIKVRPASWQNLTVSGRPAVGCIADFDHNGKPLVQFLVHALGPQTSEFFVISSPPEKFPALKTAFDSIVASYRMTK